MHEAHSDNPTPNSYPFTKRQKIGAFAIAGAYEAVAVAGSFMEGDIAGGLLMTTIAGTLVLGQHLGWRDIDVARTVSAWSGENYDEVIGIDNRDKV